MSSDFPELSRMIGGYLHQDMDLIADSVPGAMAAYARACSTKERAAVIAEMHVFLERFHNRLDEAFVRRWGADFRPSDIGRTVESFFAMVRAILADPAAARSFG